MNEFQEEVVDILKNKAAEIFGVDASTLSAETSFVDDLHCKSVNIVQFASALEDEYEVEVRGRVRGRGPLHAAQQVRDLRRRRQVRG